MRTWYRAAMTSALVALALTSFPAIAVADPGAGIDKGSLTAPDPVRPGASYELETITIFNTGDEAATYEMLAVPVNKKDKLTPDQEWFTFTPQKFELEPGAHQAVSIAMKLPGSAPAGSYEVLLGGRPIMPSDGVYVRVGAAARLKMEVAQSNVFASAFYGTMALITANAPWSYLIIAAILVAIFVALFLVIRARMADDYEEDEDEANEVDNAADQGSAPQ